METLTVYHVGNLLCAHHSAGGCKAIDYGFFDLHKVKVGKFLRMRKQTVPQIAEQLQRKAAEFYSSIDIVQERLGALEDLQALINIQIGIIIDPGKAEILQLYVFDVRSL